MSWWVDWTAWGLGVLIGYSAPRHDYEGGFELELWIGPLIVNLPVWRHIWII